MNEDIQKLADESKVFRDEAIDLSERININQRLITEINFIILNIKRNIADTRARRPLSSDVLEALKIIQRTLDNAEKLRDNFNTELGLLEQRFSEIVPPISDIAEPSPMGPGPYRRLIGIAGDTVVAAARSTSASARRAAGAVAETARTLPELAVRGGVAAAGAIAGAGRSTARTVRQAGGTVANAGEIALNATGSALSAARERVGRAAARAGPHIERAGRSISAQSEKALAFGEKVTEGAIRPTGDTIATFRKSLGKVFTPQVPSPPVPEGDPNLFTRLLSAQSVFEDLRQMLAAVRATSIWHSDFNREQLGKYVVLNLRLAKQAVLACLRFISEKADAPSVPTSLLADIDTIRELINKSVLPNISTYLEQNENHQEIKFPDGTLARLEQLLRQFTEIRQENLTQQTIDYTIVAEELLNDIGDDMPPSLTTLTKAQLDFVKYFDAVAIRNVAAVGVGRALMEFPRIDDPAVKEAVQRALESRVNLRRFSPRASSPVITSPKTPRNWRIPFIERKEPSVKDLGSGFGKKADEILKRSSLNQSPEAVEALFKKRSLQLKSSLPLSYVSDMNGTDKPVMPTQVIDSLLPFVLISNILLGVQSSSDGSPFVDVDGIEKMRNIEDLMKIVVLMSDSRRLLADNLEVTFRASNFGYFVEPAGIKILEKVTQVVGEIPSWTKNIEKISPAKASDKDIIYLEKAMSSIVLVIDEYCSICNPQTGGLCDLLPQFFNPIPAGTEVTNATRSLALRQIAERAKFSNPLSVLGTPVIRLCAAIDQVMTNVNNIRPRDKSLAKKLEKSEGTAEERAIKSMEAIHDLLKGVDYNAANTVIDWSIIKKFLQHLEDIIRDLTTVEKVQRAIEPAKANDIALIIGDLQAALIKVRKNSEYKAQISSWVEGNRILDNSINLPNWPNDGGFGKIIRSGLFLKTLYQDITFVADKEVRRDAAQELRDKEKVGKTLPASKTLEYVKSIIDGLVLPSVIDKTELAQQIYSQSDPLPVWNGRAWYDMLSKALNDVYGGQNIKTKIDYKELVADTIVIDTVSRMEQQLIKSALPSLVETMTRVKPSPATLDVAHLGEKLYEELAPLKLNLQTELLAKAVADVLPRIPTGVTLDFNKVAKDLAEAVQIAASKNHKPSALDITRILVADVAVAGTQATTEDLTSIPDRKTAIQEQLAAAIARVGGFAGGPPPAWTGVVLPPGRR